MIEFKFKTKNSGQAETTIAYLATPMTVMPLIE